MIKQINISAINTKTETTDQEEFATTLSLKTGISPRGLFIKKNNSKCLHITVYYKRAHLLEGSGASHRHRIQISSLSALYCSIYFLIRIHLIRTDIKAMCANIEVDHTDYEANLNHKNSCGITMSHCSKGEDQIKWSMFQLTDFIINTLTYTR